MDILLVWEPEQDAPSANLKLPSNRDYILGILSRRQFAEIHLLSHLVLPDRETLRRSVVETSQSALFFHNVPSLEESSPNDVIEVLMHIITHVRRRIGEGFNLCLLPSSPNSSLSFLCHAVAILRPNTEVLSLQLSGLEFKIEPDPLLHRNVTRVFDIITDVRLRFVGGKPPSCADFGEVIYSCSAMEKEVQKARRAALTDFPVLIMGESGVGKELFARAIYSNSNRRDKPFLIVNCGSLEKNLADSRLFGFAKGAFTGAYNSKDGYFQKADQGTLFLDEVGDLPLESQVLLLRALQEGKISRVGETETREVNVRIIAATNKELSKEIYKGTFREDLFWRLATCVIKVPPLRQRSETDFRNIIEHLIELMSMKFPQSLFPEGINIEETAIEEIMGLPWYGNVRELQNTLARIIMFSTDGWITPQNVLDNIIEIERANTTYERKTIVHGFNLKSEITKLATHYLKESLIISEGNQTKAARLMGLNVNTFRDWLKKYLPDTSD